MRQCKKIRILIAEKIGILHKFYIVLFQSPTGINRWGFVGGGGVWG